MHKRIIYLTKNDFRFDFFVDPPNLARLIRSEIRQYLVVLLDINPDLTTNNNLRLDLNVILKAVEIPIKGGQQYLFIGTSGIGIEAEAINGRVVNYTHNDGTDVEYKPTYQRSRKTTFSLKPKIEFKEAECELGELSFERGVEDSFESTLKLKEKTLQDIFLETAIKWQLFAPKIIRVINDFLIGNLYLDVEFKWGNNPWEGTVKITPYGINFYDNERTKIGGIYGTMWLRYELWRAKHKNIHLILKKMCEPMTIKFNCKPGTNINDR